MKKIFLLILSCLLIACMAGSAMAAGSLDLVDINGVTVTDKTIYVAPGGSTDIYLKVTSNGVSTETFYVDIDRTDDPAADVHLSPNPTSQTLDLIEGTITATDPITLSLSSDADEGEVYDVIVGNDRIHVMASAEVESIPEFPTVALPVAAILGLVFIFGRKKEGL